MKREVLYVKGTDNYVVALVDCWASVGSSGELCIHHNKTGILEYYAPGHWTMAYYKTEEV